MSGVYLSDLNGLTEFVNAVAKVEEKYGLAILLGGNTIWDDGNPIASVDFDEHGELRISGPE